MSSPPSPTDQPLLAPFTTPFGIPPFEQIRDEHYEPAFDEALREHRSEIEAIATNSEAPTFENTVEALDRSGALLTRVALVFSNLNGAHTNDRLLALARTMAPRLAAHGDFINLHEGLFARIRSVWESREQLVLDAQAAWLLEETYRGFVRRGANLSDREKERLREIHSELSLLTVRFGQNLLAATNAYELFIGREEDLAGLPDGAIAAAAESAREKGRESGWLFTLANPSVMAFLSYAKNRDLRREIWEAYQSRCVDGETDNRADLLRITNLRLERARLLGHPSHAHYTLEDSMAETPENVLQLLRDLWTPALAKAQAEEADIRAEIAAEGGDFAPEPYDWRYYTEIIRKKRYALDADALRPYFRLENVLEGAFRVAQRLYGLTFQRRTDLPLYHPEVMTYEVFDRDGSHLGVFYADFFPRPSKRVGAWMTNFRKQSYTPGGERVPMIAVNVCNFTRPVGDQPALLTLDEARTLFHEFGHALHGLLSQVRYQSLSGLSVARDFVELPSQIMENWAMHPEVLKEYARHYETGEPIPDALLERIAAVSTFDEGFGTLEYLAASFLDMAYHLRTAPITGSAEEVERAAMEEIGLIPSIVPRYRSATFQHIFSGGYAAGYYSYIWAAVLDADAFAAFEENGLYDQATATAFRKEVLERGNTGRYADLYRRFRGAGPDPRHLMKRRGLEASPRP